MDTFIVRIIFYGLVAFVPSGDPKGSWSVKVLFPDVRTFVASDGCQVPEHVPVLFAEAETCTYGGKPCTPDTEVLRLLGSEDGPFFARHYDVTPEGNFEGHTILNRLKPMQRSEAENAPSGVVISRASHATVSRARCR